MNRYFDIKTSTVKEIENDISNFHNSSGSTVYDLGCKYGCKGTDDFFILAVMRDSLSLVGEDK